MAYFLVRLIIYNCCRAGGTPGARVAPYPALGEPYASLLAYLVDGLLALALLPSGRHNRIVECLQTHQIVNTIWSYMNVFVASRFPIPMPSRPHRSTRKPWR